jgi:small subunit ribosomal protein S20
VPRIKSAQKQAQIAEKKRMRNKSVRSQSKTSVTKAERLVFAGETEAAREAVATAISSLDRAAEKGIIHANNAARRKSRLVKKLNQAQASAAEQAEASETEKEE